MRRPSHWILLSTAIGAGAYLLVESVDRAEKPTRVDDRDTVVVRRTAGQPELASALLEGRVLDQRGWPIEDAVARLLDTDLEVGAAVNGEFILPAPSFRRHRVRISAPDRQPVVRWMHPKDQLVVVLEDSLPWVSREQQPADEIEAALHGEGFLVDEGGAAIAFGVVSVMETDVSETADETGRYRIAIPAGPATLLAWDRKGRVARSQPIASTRDNGLVPLPDLVLAEGLAVRGYLRDIAGNSCTSAALTLRGHGVKRQALTDASGAFDFSGLLEGAYELEVLPHRGGLGFRRQLSVDKPAVDMDLTLAPSRSVTVQVVEATGTRPVSGAWVVAEEGDLRRAHAQTDADGMAELSGVGPGPFAFDVRDGEEMRPFEIVSYEQEHARLIVR